MKIHSYPCLNKRIPTRNSALHRAAFTLVEVLIVIAIVGILAAILLPVFNSARERTRNTTCQSNLRQIGVALELYANDHQGFYPAIDISTNGSWADAVAPYVKGDQVFTCPLAPHEFYQPGKLPTKLENGINYHFDGGYLFNAPDMQRVMQTHIRKPSQLILVTEGNTIANITQAGAGSGPLTPARLKNMGVDLRHQNGANALFADGHTKWLSADAISERKFWTLSGQD